MLFPGLRGFVWLREGGHYRAVRTEVVLEDCDVIVMLVAGNGLGPIRAACIECAEGADRVAEAVSRRYVFGDGLLASLVRLILSFSCFSLICSYLFLGNEFAYASRRTSAACTMCRAFHLTRILQSLQREARPSAAGNKSTRSSSSLTVPHA